MTQPSPAAPAIRGLLSPLTYGPGRPVVQPVAAPAAGASWPVQRVTGEAILRVKLVTVSLVTSAAVANRLVSLDYQDADGNLLFRAPAAAVQAAALTVQYSFGWGYDAATNGGTAQASPLPDVFLEQGWRVVLTVGLIDAADQVSAGRLVVEKLYTGDGGYVVGKVAPGQPFFDTEEEP